MWYNGGIIPQYVVFVKGFVSKAHILKHFWNNSLFCIKSPECRLKPQFKDAHNKAADIMTKHFTQNFIDLSGRGFSPNRTTELGFNHREDCLYIRPLMVMLEEGFSIEAKIVPHLIPQAVKSRCCTSHSFGITLKGNISCPTYGLDCVKIATAGICFIRSEFLPTFVCCAAYHICGQTIGSMFW